MSRQLIKLCSWVNIYYKVNYASTMTLIIEIYNIIIIMHVHVDRIEAQGVGVPGKI